jgi:hypothetical protein
LSLMIQLYSSRGSWTVFFVNCIHDVKNLFSPLSWHSLANIPLLPLKSHLWVSLYIFGRSHLIILWSLWVLFWIGGKDTLLEHVKKHELTLQFSLIMKENRKM